MTSKFLRFFPAAAVLVAMSAMAQTGSSTSAPAGSTGSPAASLPSAPSSTSTAPPTSVPLAAGPTKVGTINIQDAIFGSNEGRREMEVLSKKYEPKQTELKAQNDELDALKKQMTDQGPKLNEDAAANLKKTIETKQKVFDRAYQDFQEEAGNAQQEAATKILQKMAPMIVKFSQDNGFTLIVDTSKPWPQSPVLWWGEAIDITKAVVDTYNAQSGVPAPTSGAATKPAAPRSGTGTTKPATPATGSSTKPQ
jgi:outer membrane protein